MSKKILDRDNAKVMKTIAFLKKIINQKMYGYANTYKVKDKIVFERNSDGLR